MNLLPELLALFVVFVLGWGIILFIYDSNQPPPE